MQKVVPIFFENDHANTTNAKRQRVELLRLCRGTTLCMSSTMPPRDGGDDADDNYCDDDDWSGISAGKHSALGRPGITIERMKSSAYSLSRRLLSIFFRA